MTGVYTWSIWAQQNTQGQNVDKMDGRWGSIGRIQEDSSLETSKAPQDLGIQWDSLDEGIFLGWKAQAISAPFHYWKTKIC